MFVNTEQILLGVNNFIENEIAKKAVGANKFAVYFAMPIVTKKITQYLDNFSSNELTKEMFDEDKNLDLNAIYNMAKKAIQRSGAFVYCGVRFDESDVDKLYTYIRGVII